MSFYENFTFLAVIFVHHPTTVKKRNIKDVKLGAWTHRCYSAERFVIRLGDENLFSTFYTCLFLLFKHSPF